MEPKQLEAIERWNLLLSGIAILVSAVFAPTAVALGIAVGAVLACLNFTSIKRIWLAVAHAQGERRNGLQMLMIGKMILLMVLVVLAIKYLPLSPAALAIGLSVFLVSIGIESVRFVMRTPRNGNLHG